jgi:signal transduction histidine kinase
MSPLELGRMSLLRRHRWFVAAAGITLAFAAACLSGHKGPGLTFLSDAVGLALMLAGFAACLTNALTRPKEERSFWALMSLGFALWITNQAAWTIWENFLHRQVPDPFLFDIVLFFHAVPMIAAVAWRPDFASKHGKALLSVLNFLMLFGWWVFLYAFIVFPHQYVSPDIRTYNRYYDALYAVENALLVGVLALAVFTSSGGWRRLYLHLLFPSVLYAVNSQLLDRAAANSTYYSGSIYDVPLIATVAWIGAASLSAREWKLETVKYNLHPGWKKLVGRLAMLAILSLPILGLWTVLDDTSSAASRSFRVFAVLGAMLLLGTFVFLRQYLQDQALMALLKESRRAYDSQKELQRQLVQKEKLASLGNLVAGAAHDINHPLSAVMTHSDELWANAKLSEEQDALLRKIVNQARRTRDLITNLLSFAQQAPGEKTAVDLSVLLGRAIQMLESRRPGGKIQFRMTVEPEFPRVLANANQLFQAFIEIIENAVDALEESGGVLEISAQRQDSEVMLQFSDNGPGLRDPERVFDPFYTTKPVGKGTGLGLSAVYGVVQDHGGQITCGNKPEGGAQFTIKLPVTAVAAQSAVAAH